MVVLGYPMLLTKFQGHWSTGSGEEDLKNLKVFTIYGHGGHIGHVTLRVCTKFLFPQPKEALNEIWSQLAQWGIEGVDVLRIFYF